MIKDLSCGRGGGKFKYNLWHPIVIMNPKFIYQFGKGKKKKEHIYTLYTHTCIYKV